MDKINNLSLKSHYALSYENQNVVNKISVELNITEHLAHDYFFELKRFLYLCSISEQKLAPTPEIDKAWHTFILFTKDYRLYCHNYLSMFIDHIPETKKSISKENYLKNTISLYHKTFGKLNNNVWQVKVITKTLVSAECESEHSCVFTGNCFNCTDSGQSCVGENPNDL
jgi:hypothetical protein